MKQYLLLLFLNMTCVLLFGQLNCPPVAGGSTVSEKFHMTLGAGFTRLYGDIDNPGKAGWGTYGRLDYTIIRGLNIGGEGQIGSLEADSTLVDPRSVKGKYANLGISMSVYPFDMAFGTGRRMQSFGEQVARGFYLGVGAGFIYNFHRARNYRNLNDPSTYGPLDSDDIMNPKFKQRTGSLLLPVLNTGFSIPFTKDTFRRSGGLWSLVINGQFNFADNDDMDGYVPLKPDGTRLGKSNDYYSFYSVGIRYSM